MQFLQTTPPRMRLIIPERKHVDFDSPTLSPNGGHLTPELAPNTPPVFPTEEDGAYPGVSRVGDYILVSPFDSKGQIHLYKSFHVHTNQQYLCKVIALEKYHDSLQPYWRVGSHDHLNEVEQVILGKTKAYVFFGQHYGDLHTYVRTKKRLREAEVSRLFSQIVSALERCHENGVILRDLKLRKFVFKDPERTQLKLVGLEDAHLLNDCDDDSMSDKHGCPAYVSPEILNPNKSYSGKAADMWSIGVMLYTMLVGRYPFHDREPSTLFMKIRRGEFAVPDTISSRGKCLLRSLLRREPSERLTACEVAQHPWFTHQLRLQAWAGVTSCASSMGSTSAAPEPLSSTGSSPRGRLLGGNSTYASESSGSGSNLKAVAVEMKEYDQIVPTIEMEETEDFFM